MNRTLSNIMMLTAGAVIGSLVTYKIMKTNCDKVIQEEVDAFKDYYRKERGVSVADEVDDSCESETIEEELTEPTMRDYSQVLKHCKYDTAGKDAPYTISPDEYGEIEEYETQSLTYYADGYLVDDISDEPIEAIDDVVGADSLERFGEYEENSVFVRNDKYKCDYEILLDKKRYSEIRNSAESHDMEE